MKIHACINISAVIIFKIICIFSAMADCLGFVLWRKHVIKIIYLQFFGGHVFTYMAKIDQKLTVFPPQPPLYCGDSLTLWIVKANQKKATHYVVYCDQSLDTFCISLSLASLFCISLSLASLCRLFFEFRSTSASRSLSYRVKSNNYWRLQQ